MPRISGGASPRYLILKSRRSRDPVARYTPSAAVTPVPALVGYTLAELAGHSFPDRKALFIRGDTAVFRAGHLGEGMLSGAWKTWFLQTLALVAATGSEPWDFAHPNRVACSTSIAEMASHEIQDRFARLEDRLGTSHPKTLTVVAADWQEQYLPRLDTDTGQALVEPFVEVADLIFLDNRSCLFDPDGEKDPTAWQPAQDWLLSLRRRGKAVRCSSQ